MAHIFCGLEGQISMKNILDLPDNFANSDPNIASHGVDSR